jgi:hypothetical protein
MSRVPQQRPTDVEQEGPNLVVVRGPLTPGALERLCRKVEALLLAEPARPVVCRLQGALDLTVVDALARVQLTAKRLGARVTVTGAEQLLRRAGLSEVIRQAEPREQGGVEEVVDVRDLPG